MNLNYLITDKLYSCKANDEEGQDLSCNCKSPIVNGEYVNCTCFAENPPTGDPTYLDCLDALRKGNRLNGIYLLKPDNMPPFKV